MLSKDESLFYSRHLSLPHFGEEAQLKLKHATVLVIGAGGLGVPVLQYLAAAGVGSIIIMDGDRVDKTNLHRQVIYTIKDVGFSKAHIAKHRLEQLNPYIEIEAIQEHIQPDNALQIIRRADIVIDCSDNFSTRYLVNDACVIEKKPLIYGAIDQFSGQVSVFNYNGGPTYRCLFPDQPDASEAPSCSEIGVLGVLPGIIGNYQALECIKVITGIGNSLSGTLLMINTLDQTHLKIAISPNPDYQSISELSTYSSTVCDSEIPSISYAEYIAMENTLLLDVREVYEYQIDNLGGLHIPLNELPKHVDQFYPHQKIAVLCAKGIRSLHACEFLASHGIQAFNIKGGLSEIRSSSL